MVSGYLLVLLSAVGFGVLPIFALFAYDSGVSVATLLFLRFVIAAVIFFGCVFLYSRTWNVSRRQLVSLLLLGGVFYTLQSSAYFLSVKYIPASLATLLFYLYPVFVAVLSFFFNKETLSKRLIVSVLISLGGMGLVLGTPNGDINAIGVLFALGAGVVYSLYIIIGDRVTSSVPPIVTSAYIALFASTSFFVWGLATDSLHFSFSKIGWLSIIGVAIFSTVLSMLTFFIGMNKTGPTKASIVSMVEPIVTILFSFALLHEQMAALQILGGAIVLTGAVLVIIAKEKQHENSQSS
ncbi:threonine/homoserine efflux transporter RhtA [Aneurinibacillus soli]|uniref:Threonine/homoserine exporter RhtA n=1 Tax=Aneurinibacillus soli TaxID=1500254 RepID=A0A0U4WNL2_9BACL|nr:DMT family transporter [Aneurinibacillus soli]PYE60644.1 threonine/homoserine efflux transporter RhtA [Aneurinibacillus soli]BAU29832.1 Threonine/homoserine exporter RhtA [Aneurinibacillus soli]